MFERKKSVRHAELRIEVLVAGEDDKVAGGPGRPHPVTGLAVKSAQTASNVRRDAGQQPERRIQRGGAGDRYLGELAAKLQPAGLVARVGFSDGDPRVQPGNGEARSTGPPAGAERQARRADVFGTAGIRDMPDVRFEALLAAIPDAFIGRESSRIERRHHVGAIT